MAEIKRLKKGLDIHLYGGASDEVTVDNLSKRFAIVPDDYPGFVWKSDVKIGDNVMVGTPLLRDKDTSEIKVCSPVCGVVTEIRRGERRKIEAVVVDRSAEDKQVQMSIPTNRDELIALLCECGLWAMIRQRPYDVIPSPKLPPRDIFVTAFDSAPLAKPLLTAEQISDLECGLKALTKMTDGKVYLGVKFGSGISSSAAIVTEYRGPHPAGNTGVQIASIKPVNKGEVVWCLDARTVARIGKVVSTGVLDMSTEVALTGELVVNPHIIKTVIGVELKTVLQDAVKNDAPKCRVISGNVLTGAKVDAKEDFLRYPYRQITIIPEGDDTDEFMGWASLSPQKFSVKHSFTAFLRGLSRQYRFDARIKGGHRAMIVSGEYDKVFPMDIYPEYLIKAILAFDIDKMEQLGIYEVAPEDFALAEFVDTSKLELQKIVREGLERLRKELN